MFFFKKPADNYRCANFSQCTESTCTDHIEEKTAAQTRNTNKEEKKPEITQETPANSTTATNEETELLKRKTKALKSKVFRLTKKLNTPSKQSSQCKKLNIAIECISQYLNGPALEFFKTQIKAGKMKLRGYKWSEKKQKFCYYFVQQQP